MNGWKLLRTGICLASAALVLGLFVAGLWAVGWFAAVLEVGR